MAILNVTSRTKMDSEFFCLFVLLYRAVLWHMEVPKLRVILELQLLATPQQHQIQASSATYTTAHGKVRSLTH